MFCDVNWSGSGFIPRPCMSVLPHGHETNPTAARSKFEIFVESDSVNTPRRAGAITRQAGRMPDGPELRPTGCSAGGHRASFFGNATKRSLARTIKVGIL